MDNLFISDECHGKENLRKKDEGTLVVGIMERSQMKKEILIMGAVDVINKKLSRSSVISHANRSADSWLPLNFGGRFQPERIWMFLLEVSGSLNGGSPYI